MLKLQLGSVELVVRARRGREKIGATSSHYDRIHVLREGKKSIIGVQTLNIQG